jgi:tetratricopeptide (TPR) repeat protein
MMRLRFAPTSEYIEWAERGQREAHAALQLDPQLAEAHEALAAVNRAIDFDWAKTLDESGLALALNPHLDQPHLYRAAAFYHLGLFDLIEPALQAAAAGLSPAIQRPDNVIETERIHAISALLTGRFQDAVGLFEQVKRSTTTSSRLPTSTRVMPHEPRTRWLTCRPVQRAIDAPRRCSRACWPVGTRTLERLG